MILGLLGYPSWLLPLVGWSAGGLFVVVVIGNALRPKYRRLFGPGAFGQALWNALLPSVTVQIYLWVALIVLWTPIWWLARGFSSATGLGSATGWFVAAVVAFYGGWLIRGFSGHSVSQASADRAAFDAGPPDEIKRVAVIGAGMAGLVAAKELRDEGHDVVVFERTAGPGGVWASSKARGGVAWGSTITSTGALNTTLSDSPTAVFHRENDLFPHHFDRQQFLALLQDYEAAHRVFDGVLRCNVEVDSMTSTDDDRWLLEVRDTTTHQRWAETFDAVTICTGLNKEPHLPAIDGQDHFAGEQLHAEHYRPDEVERFAGKRVLVIGMGETSSDVVKDLVDHGAEHVYVSQRGATWVIPRTVGNVPPDHVETRLLHEGPMLHRWAMLLTGVAPYGLFPLLRAGRVRPPKFRHVFRILVRHHPEKWLLWRLGSMNWTKSDNLYFALDTGRATVLRDVDRLTRRTAVFADGNEHEIDAVVYCTGYRPGASLLPPAGSGQLPRMGSTEAPRSARDLYKLTMPPDHPNVAVIGFARGQIGAITLSTELQARWWALVVSGKRELPSPARMRADVAALRHHGRRFHQPTRTTPCFAYSVARQDIGCAPDLFELFRRDRRLWFAVLMGPVCGAHFRLRGPQARPERAREQLVMPQAIQSEDYVDNADLLTSTLPLSALLVPLMGAYTRILPGFNARSATRSYI